MSFEALHAVSKVDPPSSSALLLLFILAEYAGPDGACYPSQATLSERSRMSVRAVRDNLAALRDAELIACEPRRRSDGSRSSDIIRLLFYTASQQAEQPAKSAGCKKPPKANKSSEIDENSNRRNLPVDNRQPLPGPPAAVAGPTTFEPVRLTSEDISNEIPSLDASEREASEDKFEKAFAAYPVTGRTRTDIPAARKLWAGVAGSIDPGRLLAAVRRYAAEDRDLKRGDHGAQGLHRWLAAERWRHWLPDEAVAAVASPANGVRSDEWRALRAAVARDHGDGFTGSYLDPCGWSDAERLLTPRTKFAADKLRRAAGSILAKFDVRVGDV